jgi:hypothetical protein
MALPITLHAAEVEVQAFLLTTVFPRSSTLGSRWKRFSQSELLVSGVYAFAYFSSPIAKHNGTNGLPAFIEAMYVLPRVMIDALTARQIVGSPASHGTPARSDGGIGLVQVGRSQRCACASGIRRGRYVL